MRLFSTAKHKLNLKLRVVCLLAKPFCSLSYGSITLLESDHDIVGYKLIELASAWLIANLGTVIAHIN